MPGRTHANVPPLVVSTSEWWNYWSIFFPFRFNFFFKISKTCLTIIKKNTEKKFFSHLKMTENTNELSFKKRGDQDSAGTNQCTGLESDAAWNLAPPPTPWLWAHRRSSQPGSPSEGGFSSNLSQKLLGILSGCMQHTWKSTCPVTVVSQR